MSHKSESRNPRPCRFQHRSLFQNQNANLRKTTEIHENTRKPSRSPPRANGTKTKTHTSRTWSTSWDTNRATSRRSAMGLTVSSFEWTCIYVVCLHSCYADLLDLASSLTTSNQPVRVSSIRFSLQLFHSISQDQSSDSESDEPSPESDQEDSDANEWQGIDHESECSEAEEWHGIEHADIEREDDSPSPSSTGRSTEHNSTGTHLPTSPRIIYSTVARRCSLYPTTTSKPTYHRRFEPIGGLRKTATTPQGPSQSVILLVKKQPSSRI